MEGGPRAVEERARLRGGDAKGRSKSGEYWERWKLGGTGRGGIRVTRRGGNASVTECRAGNGKCVHKGSCDYREGREEVGA